MTEPFTPEQEERLREIMREEICDAIVGALDFPEIAAVWRRAGYPKTPDIMRRELRRELLDLPHEPQPTPPPAAETLPRGSNA